MKTYQQVDELTLVHSGNNFFEILEKLIDNSKEVLQLQTYIFDADSTGLKIISALKKAAQRGVKITIVIDAFGSTAFSNKIIPELVQLGIRFRFFSPFFSSENITLFRRLHHKIVVADKKIALIGGINISDKYRIAKKSLPWLDYAVLIKGNACDYLDKLCSNIYEKKLFDKIWHGEAQQKTLASPNDSKLIRFRRNDWFRRKNDIYKSYLEAIIHAKKSIIIVASYFLPGITFRNLLAKAARRGVCIKIILAGKTDLPSIRVAENYLYDFYFRNKIEIYEWSNSVLHGKAMLVDDQWATIGSFNLNSLSRYISIELNVDIIDPLFTKTFAQHLQTIIKDYCKSATLLNVKKKRNLVLQFKKWCAYTLYKIVIEIMLLGRKHPANW